MTGVKLLIGIENAEKVLLKIVLDHMQSINYKILEDYPKKIVVDVQIKNGEEDFLRFLNDMIQHYGKDFSITAFGFFKKEVRDPKRDSIVEMIKGSTSIEDAVLKVKKFISEKYPYLHEALITHKIMMKSGKFYIVSDGKYIGDVGDEENINHLLYQNTKGV